MTCSSECVSSSWRVFSDSFLFVFCQLSDYGLKHWNAGEGPCLTVKFIKQTKSTTFLLHLKICFHHHVLLWPNWNMLSSFCQRLCKSTWGGVLILLPKGFIKYTFYQITFYKRTCCCQDLFSNETWNNTNATATLFTTILLSLMFSHVKHFPISQWYFNVLHYQIVLSFLFDHLTMFFLASRLPCYVFSVGQLIPAYRAKCTCWQKTSKNV